MAKTNRSNLRLALSVIAPDLISVPWEFLHDGTGFLFERGVSIVRIIDTLPDEPAPFGPPQRPLLVCSDPRGDLQPATHIEALRDHLLSLGIPNLRVIQGANRENLRSALDSVSPDMLYFLGHGRMGAGGMGEIILETAAGPGRGEDALSAVTLASWLRHVRDLRLAFFNSCSTAQTKSNDNFTGVAQRVMLDGGVEAVIAMQAPILAVAAVDIAKVFFEKLKMLASPEEALTYARSVPKEHHSSGIPVVYSRLSGPEHLERQHVEAFLDADRDSSFQLFIPSLRMGLLAGEYDSTKVVVTDPSLYHYSGETLPLADIKAAWSILSLLDQITDLRTRVSISTPGTPPMSGATHFFYFGSRSHRRVGELLRVHSPRFRFQYGSDTWTLEDCNYGKKYSLPDPRGKGKAAYHQNEDFGIIEKIVEKEHRRVHIILAGLGSRATEGCGWYLSRKWHELLAECVTGEFGILLKFPGGMGPEDATRIDRKTGEPLRN